MADNTTNISIAGGAAFKAGFMGYAGVWAARMLLGCLLPSILIGGCLVTSTAIGLRKIEDHAPSRRGRVTRPVNFPILHENQAERGAQYDANTRSSAGHNAPTTPTQKKAVEKTAKTLKRIYPLASPEGTKRVGMISEGATVTVLSTSGEFVKVSFGTVTGWTEQSSIE